MLDKQKRLLGDRGGYEAELAQLEALRGEVPARSGNPREERAPREHWCRGAAGLGGPIEFGFDVASRLPAGVGVSREAAFDYVAEGGRQRR